MFKRGFVVLFFSVTFFILLHGQETSKFGLKSVGLDLGWYNPALDYWQNESEFKEADFTGAFDVKGFVEFSLISDLSARMGIGFWQTSTEEDLQGFGLTTWTLTGYPVALDLIYYPKPLRFSVVSPYLGIGGEFIMLQQKLNFATKENPDPVNGSSALFDGIVGLEAKLSDQFALNFEFSYKVGKYNQDFDIEVDNPDDPLNPFHSIITEEISLSGPQIGIALKYLF